jgi:hypothetical protein
MLRFVRNITEMQTEFALGEDDLPYAQEFGVEAKSRFVSAMFPLSTLIAVCNPAACDHAHQSKDRR